MILYGSVYQSYSYTGQSSDPSGLVGSHWAKSVSDKFPSEPNMTRQAQRAICSAGDESLRLSLALILCPFKMYRDSVQGGMVDSKSYCTIVKTHRDETSQVTDLSPG